MSEPNKKQKKQYIESVNILKELNENKEVTHLYTNVVKTFQMANNIVSSMKKDLENKKKEQSLKAKESPVKVQAKKTEAPKESAQEKESFAELFALSNGEKIKKEEPVVKKEEVKTSKTETISKLVEKKEPVKQNPIKENVSTSTTQRGNLPRNNSNLNPRNQHSNNTSYNNQSTNRPYNNANASRPNNQYKPFTYKSQQDGRPGYRNSTFSSGNYQNNGGANRQGYNANKPFNNYRNNNGQRPNTFHNGNQRANFNPNYNNRNFNYQGNNQFGNNGVRNQNKALMDIIPKKNSSLASAEAAFATKERTFGNKKKSNNRGDEDRRINKKSLLRRGLIEEQNIEERMVTRKLKLKKPKVETTPIVSAPITNAVITTPNLTVKLLSEKIGKPVTEIIKQLMVLGVMATINSTIDFATAELVSSELGVTLELKIEKTFEEKLEEDSMIDDGTNKESRAPIVTIVGHVDHGKTSLLDYIRKTHITSGEAGGITQAIGAYSIKWKNKDITFIDTPGHEAFINMRKRGTEITDVAVLIIAGDDGVKPQTVEAIKHIKSAKAPMIVAITKIDKPTADIERIKQQLTEHDVLPEEWGGDAIIVPVSSKTGEGIDNLLETILLVAEMQELKCNRSRDAVGTVIEAMLDKNRGPVANVIVRNGTLKLGDNIMSGFALGKVRALIDDKGRSIKKAGPSTPVSILGFDSVPNAGDSMQVVDEKFSKSVIEERRIRRAQEKIENGMPKSLDEFLSTPAQEDLKKLNLIIKADNQGSAEALRQSLCDLKNEEVKVEIVSCSVGNVTENDIQLAKVSESVIVSFDTKVMAKISNFAKQNKVEIRQYDIIYQAIEDIEKLLKSMMSPKYEEKVVGHAEVKALFKISSVGTIAGSYVLDGKIVRNANVKVMRGDETIFEGRIATLKRNKDDVKDVNAGYECGIKVDDFNAVQEGDILECIVKERIN